MNYKAKTMLTPQEALNQAKAYFGPGGQGMAVVSQSDHSLRLRGRSGGHVNIETKHRLATTMTFEARSWDDAVRQFIAGLPQPRPWWRVWGRSGANAKPSAA